VRLMYCYLCCFIELLDDFEVDFKDPRSTEHDVLLSNWIDRHLHGKTVDEHPGGRMFSFDDSRAGIDTDIARGPGGTTHIDFDIFTEQAVQQVKKELQNNQMEVMGYRDQLREDAGNCFIRHGNPEYPGKPCIDFEAADKRLGRKNTPKKFQQYLCTYCAYTSSVTVSKRHRRGDYR
jgi:hypothetical protein